METVVRLNGKESNRFKTNDMIFGIVPFIVELTKYFTLWPGDVIWMGTDGASPDLRDGDVVEIEITGIGCLRNRFVAEKRSSAARLTPLSIVSRLNQPSAYPAGIGLRRHVCLGIRSDGGSGAIAVSWADTGKGCIPVTWASNSATANFLPSGLVIVTLHPSLSQTRALDSMI